jgi:hypothetical protein
MGSIEASDVPPSAVPPSAVEREQPPSPRRKRRHRARALLLASLGWVVCAAAAAMLAGLSPATPLALLVTGAVLLTLCARGRGEVPFAAVGVAASGVVASVAAAAFVAGDPAHALPPAAVSALIVTSLALALPSLAVRAASVRSDRLRWAVLGPWLVVAALGAATFPARRTIEVQVAETFVVAGLAGSTEVAPAMGARAADRDGLVAEDDGGAAPLLTATRWTRRARTLPVAILLVWGVGLALAIAGALVLRRTLVELRRLEGAVRVRRTRSGFVLDDGELVFLDREPTEDEALAVLDRRSAHYRTSARIAGVVVGAGSLAIHCETLRRRMMTVALGTVMTAGAAWLPLVILRAHGIG